MKKIISLLFVLALYVTNTTAQSGDNTKRALWASIAKDQSDGAISLDDYKQYSGKILISWRMLPGDDENTGFDLYRKIGNGTESQLNRKLSTTGGVHWEVTPITTTNWQDNLTSFTNFITYRLTYSGSDETLDEFTIPLAQLKAGQPYITIPLKGTEDVINKVDTFVYRANDCSVGDLDGDGEMEIVVKRLLGSPNGNIDGGTGAADSDPRARHTILWDAYKLDGTFLWRIQSGPNIILGNSSNFAIADLDGDGCCEMVTKTSEGTIFGDGYEIPDTDGDGKTDYRDIWPAGHYTGDGPKGYGGPEFFSVIDGKTGKELARANFIARGKEGETPAQLAANWEANDWKWDPRTKKYTWKLANSLRLGVARFTGNGLQIFLGRGVYGRTVVEGWQYDPTPSGDFAGTLTRLWKFDTDTAGGKDKNKDGKLNSAYAGQGNHSFNVADLDGDGLDEIMYGSCAFDNDGTGLWSTGLGHGDANHVGKFLPEREGLQVFHCLESGTTMVALHDAKDGKVIWKKVGDKDNDCGRCMVADIDPNSPGCEFFWAGSNAYSQDGSTDLGYKPSSCNAAIWFDGSLTRQLINENIISNDRNGGRTFTMYRFDESFNNGTKSNPGWYGDMVGDWREEVILPDRTKLANIKVFSTWYPTEHKFPWLMTDHHYYMGVVNENVGYNQPPNLSYYLGSDLTSDREAWENAGYIITDIHEVNADKPARMDNNYYSLSGQRLAEPPVHGVYIHNGKKYIR